MLNTFGTIGLALALALLMSTWSPVESAIPRAKPDQAANFSLTLLHINDIHCHFEPINQAGGRCRQEDLAAGQCYGGQARLQTILKTIRQQETGNLLFLNAGDYYQGTVWYSLFKYVPVVQFGNMLGLDAMSVGNHDFDDGNEGLSPLLDGANYRLMAANLEGLPSEWTGKLTRSWVFGFDGGKVKVGVVGYVFENTPSLSNPGPDLVFTDEVEAVRREALRLRDEDGVGIIIALGHSGYDVDLRIAAEVPEVDVVVGGHSHSLLWDAEELGLPVPPFGIRPSGPYPTYVKSAASPDPEGRTKETPVVQVFCCGSILGHLTLNFDESGELLQPVKGRGVSFARPILIEQAIPEDPAVADLIASYRQNMTSLNETLGQALVDLEEQGYKESNLGDLIADSMVEFFSRNASGSSNATWVPIVGFINNGGIRADILRGTILLEDIFNTLPFQNQMHLFELNGTQIRHLLEHYASGLCGSLKSGATYNAESDCNTEFLQVAGIRVRYLIAPDNRGSRVASLKVACSPHDWCDMDPDKIYRVATCSFLRDNFVEALEGCGGMPDVSKDLIGPADTQVLADFIRQRNLIDTMVDERLVVEYVRQAPSSSPSVHFSAMKPWLEFQVIIAIAIGWISCKLPGF